MMHPNEVNAGEVTEIFNYVSRTLLKVGFEIRSEGTYQTKQIYLNGITRPIGAVQYEGSNDFEKKLPTTVNLRFNRVNIPEQWKVQLENEHAPHRKILKTVITHKFSSFDEDTRKYIYQLCVALSNALK